MSKLSQETLDQIKAFVQDLKSHGYTKYKVTQEVAIEFEMYYERAYYYVRKFLDA